MRPVIALLLAVGMTWLAGCAGQDPDVRRGDMFFKNKKYEEAAKSYGQALKRVPKLLEDPTFRENYKNANFYYGGQLELSGSLDAAVEYYVVGFKAQPTDAGICDKLAKYYWEQEDFENAAYFFGVLVEMDATAADTDQKWEMLHQDYYALGYSLFKAKKYQEAIDALQQSLKAKPKGRMAGQVRSAMEAAKQKLSQAK